MPICVVVVHMSQSGDIRTFFERVVNSWSGGRYRKENLLSGEISECLNEIKKE